MGAFFKSLNIKFSKSEVWALGFLILLSAVLRLWGLGYSNFYGDETKTLYLDKTVPAIKFFLDQRKGPLQFFIVWVVENVTGGFSEFWVRFPFALAGLFSVFAFYIVVKKLFNSRVAFISALIFSVSGFNIAFARTAQYQTLLMLFGLLSIYSFLEALDSKQYSKFLYSISAVFMSLAFYSHYDALIYLVPLLFVFFYKLINEKINAKEILIYFFVPFVALIALFYIPYIYQGYLEKNTIGYLGRRFNGSGYLLNNSLYTFSVYNPVYMFFGVLLAGFYFFFDKKINEKNLEKNMLLIWFLVPFITFELLILNPGTHIQSYFVPFYILSGYSIVAVFNALKNYKVAKYIYGCFVGIVLFLVVAISALIYIPAFKIGYPWKEITFGPINLSMPDRRYHLFLYGFPYNRGWNQIQKYMYSLKGVRGIYTNDDDTIAEYYLMKYDYTPPGSNFLPQYYIHVFNNQKFEIATEKFYVEFLSNYEEQQKFFEDGELVAIVFKLKSVNSANMK